MAEFLEQERILEYQKAFNLLDDDKRGTISTRHLIDVLNHVKVDVTDDEFEDLLI